MAEDRVRKFTQYEQAGVREYWIIDPRPRQQQVDCYTLGKDKTFYPAPIDEDGIYRLTAIRDFWFNTDWFWQEKLPNPQLALAQIMVSIEELPAGVKQTYQALYDLLAARS